MPINNAADDADAALSQARRSMTRLAINLQQVLTPIEVAGVLAGAATGVLTSTYGREKAVEYFTELACELSVPQGTPEGPTKNG
jgi:hypothetical protein